MRIVKPPRVTQKQTDRGDVPGDTREAFDAAVEALVAEARRTGGASLALEPTPITSPDQITDDLTYHLAYFPVAVRGRRLKFVKTPHERDDVLGARQEGLKQTLRKLVRSQRVNDVAAVINALDDARWRHLEQYGRRDQPRLARKLKQMKAAADKALRQLIQYHRAADQMVRRLLGPGTIDEYMAGRTERLYPASKPALSYMAAHDALLRDGRLNPPFLQHSARRDHNPPHQQLLADVRSKLRGLGVSKFDITNLLRDTGLLALTRFLGRTLSKPTNRSRLFRLRFPKWGLSSRAQCELTPFRASSEQPILSTVQHLTPWRACAPCSTS
jgi:hypothetical protein